MKRIHIFSLLVVTLFLSTALANEKLTDSRTAQKRKRWTFKDGADNPLSLATGEVFQRIEGSSEGRRCASFVLDESGQCRWLYASSKKASYYIILRHPDYGAHRLTVPSSSQEHVFHIQVVLEGTEAYERSIRGFVLNDANTPLSGVSIRAKAIYPPGGQTVYAAGFVRTDEFGWFHLYPLVYPNYKTKIGKLIPPNSCCLVRIEAPKELLLAPAMVCISNDGEQVIQMKDPGYFHTIAFEDGDGRITNRDRLIRFHLQINRSGIREIEFEYGEFKNGRLFSLGTYTIDNWARDCEFEPIEVTAESPEQLVFKSNYKRGDIVTYSGKVVHGITREPMEGAFVVAIDGVLATHDEYFSRFTWEEWDRLHSLPWEFSANRKTLDKLVKTSFKNGAWVFPSVEGFPEVEAALRPVHKMFMVKKGVRTDGEGIFAMAFRKDEKFSELLFFEEDYLCVTERRLYQESDSKGNFRIRAVPLFPAAKVIVEPHIVNGNTRIIPQWIFDANDCPEWVERRYERAWKEDDALLDESFDIGFEKEPNRVRTITELGYGRSGAFTYCRDLARNKPRTIPVPAGVNLKVQVRPLQDMKNKWVPFTYPQTIKLEQGETLDLGRCEIRRSIHVFVKVVDSAGNPLEGIPVDNPIEEWKGAQSTNSYGMTRFNVYPHSKGEFSVRCRKHNVREAIPYKIGGEEDAGREFTMVISDKMLKHFSK